jgi:Replication-relaxation
VAGARYWFTEDVFGRKIVELEVGRDGHLYRRRGMLGQLLGDDDGPVALAVSAKPLEKAPGVVNNHARECMCRECRIAQPGVFCPYWLDDEPADAGHEPLRAHWSQIERCWRSTEEVEAEQRRWAEERLEREHRERAKEAERLRAEAEAAAEAERLLEHRRSQWPPPVLDPAPAASYDEVHRYDGVLLTWGTRAQLRKPVVPTQRDVDILQALWRHRVLSSSQIKALWWPTAQLRKAQERLKELFDLGLVDKFRPPSLRGSYQWSYCLDRGGHDLLKDLDLIPSAERFRPRAIGDFKTVLHALQLNAWVIAYRDLTGERLREWRGEPDSRIEFSSEARRQLAARTDLTGLQLDRPQPIWPDAALEVERTGGGISTLLVEFDRTQRPDKNHSKFLRYDALLCSWWRESVYGERGRRPLVLFVCQDEASLEAFMRAADDAFTGRTNGEGHAGRERALFVLEQDVHRRSSRAWLLPEAQPRRREGAFLPRPVGLPID